MNYHFWTGEFTVGSNDLSGQLPDELGDMTRMETLWLYLNGFSGEIPASVAGMASLVSFDVFGNDLSGDLSTAFVGLENLRSLGLGKY